MKMLKPLLSSAATLPLILGLTACINTDELQDNLDNQDQDQQQQDQDNNQDNSNDNQTQGKPDLVARIFLDGNVLTAEVANKGDADVSEDASGHTYIYIDDMNNPAWTYSWSTLADTGFKQAGHSSRIQPQILEGAHEVKVCVDPNNVVEEYNETNNCHRAKVGQLPDLTAKVYVDDSSYLTVDVANIGSADVDSSIIGSTYIYIDDMTSPAWTYGWGTLADTSFYYAGHSSLIQPQILTGQHHVKACVDYHDQVVELDESNNCFEALVGELPDLTVGVFLDGNILTVDQSNIGLADVDASIIGSTYIYIDDMENPAWTYSWGTLADTSFYYAGHSSWLQPQVLTGEHKVKACIDYHNDVAEADEANNCVEAVLGEPEGQPDLTTFVYIDDRNILTVEQSNIGTADVDPAIYGSTYIYIDDLDHPVWTYSWSTLADTSFYQVGMTSLLQPQVLEGAHTVKACIDARDDVVELDEHNNCMTVSVGGQPDLTIPDIYLAEGDVLTVDVSNIGTADIDPSVVGSTYIYIDDMENPAWTYSWSTLADKSFYEAGETSPLQPQVLSGYHVVKACVDNHDDVAEINEDNNCTRREIGELPDLTAEVSLGDNDVLAVKVSNIGLGDVDATQVGHTYIFIDDMDHPVWTYSWSTLADTSFYQAGQSSTITPQVLHGYHQVKACVDPNDVVVEADELNNCHTTMVGNLPDLTAALSLGAGDVLTVTVSNIGLGDVDPDVVGSTYIYIDDMDHPVWTYSWSTLADTSFYLAGESSVMTPQVLDGEHLVKVCVDANDDVLESDEGNNCDTQVLGQDPLPDLIAEVSVSDSGALQVLVTNIGTADIDPDLSGHTFIYIDDMENPVWTYSWSTLADTSFYAAGGSATITPQLISGDHLLKACVDPLDVVAEIDEANNCHTIKYIEP